MVDISQLAVILQADILVYLDTRTRGSGFFYGRQICVQIRS
jgi:hypothetical protein